MNLGSTILELRKRNNITQDELAAELGVTAAAVSKWENGYTLPDILMLCALADYFVVTTDELLGRNKQQRFAVIAAETMQLGQRIAQKAEKNGIIVHGIFGEFSDAHKAALLRSEVTHILAGYTKEIPNELTKEIQEPLHFCQSISDSEEKILDGFDMIFEHFLR